MNARALALCVLVACVGCAAPPEPKVTLTADERVKAEYVRIIEQQALDKADATGAIPWLEWVCAQPQGPEREAAKKLTIEKYGMQPICGKAPEKK